jgi:copper homeostasis protein
LAVGGLTNTGQLDVSLLQAIGKLAGPTRQLVMHRAFDFLIDPHSALDQLVQLGFTRVLTSGGPLGQTAAQLDRLRGLVHYAAGRIEILPGGGVGPENASNILSATGCSQLHGSFRRSSPKSTLPSGAFSSHPAFGTQPELDLDALRKTIDPQLAHGSQLGL